MKMLPPVYLFAWIAGMIAIGTGTWIRPMTALRLMVCLASLFVFWCLMWYASRPEHSLIEPPPPSAAP